MKLHTFIWLLATYLCAVQALPTGKVAQVPHGGKTACALKPKLHKRSGTQVCTVNYKGNAIAVKGELVHNLRGGGKLYKVTEASGVPEGRYVVKTGLGEHERHVSLASGLAIASTKPDVQPAESCILMKFVGKDIRTLTSYQAVEKNLAQCKVWVKTRLEHVKAAVTEFRRKAGDYAHTDICPENTRWENDVTVHIIDYGEACTPAHVDGTHDRDNFAMYETLWENELCEPSQRRPAPADPDVQLINRGCD
ncbi:hypothetical protein FRC17_007981 [Serendipita sp. 399]|nr:hypothetical protein FRC17_007981 [Serendipita sp. 399]